MNNEKKLILRTVSIRELEDSALKDIVGATPISNPAETCASLGATYCGTCATQPFCS